MPNPKRIFTLFLIAVILMTSAGCASVRTKEEREISSTGVCILFTGDVHCAYDHGFGYAGLWQIRDNLNKQGYKTILVDSGDSIQGEPVGTISKGESIITLMNDVSYDLAIPGKHEFDYGTDRFLELVEKADFKYLSCNFTHQDKLVLEPYTIIETPFASIAFVGITTPYTMLSNPANFTDQEGNYAYDFMFDETGDKLYDAVQRAVDEARENGADYVYAISHLGSEALCKPWTYADVIANTYGIDMFLDGRNHDTEKIFVKNLLGKEVLRLGAGKQLNSIGYSFINQNGSPGESGLYSWTNDTPLPALLGMTNAASMAVDELNGKTSQELSKVIASASVDLTINDPSEKNSNGEPLRKIRLAETNIGDLIADAFRDQTGADIAVVNSGSIRKGLTHGDIDYGEIISVQPYGNMICVLEVTGQDILDALEWSARLLPEENGGFLQVSGLTYEIDPNVKSGCTEDEHGFFTGVKGTARRTRNVMLGDEPIDPEKTYTLAGNQYILLEHGDGYTMFDDSPIVQDRVKLDNQALIDYITGSLNGIIGNEYSNPRGQGRITIIRQTQIP